MQHIRITSKKGIRDKLSGNMIQDQPHAIAAKNMKHKCSWSNCSLITNNKRKICIVLTHTHKEHACSA